MLIKLDKQDIEKCKVFSELKDNTFYNSRGQYNENKKRLDNFYSKQCECAFSKWGKENGLNITEPDFSILKISDKSWDADLIINNIYNLHVKSNIKNNRKISSFVIQKNDYHLYLEPQNNDYLGLASYISDGLIDLLDIIKVKFIHENNLLKKMEISHLNSNKCALYLEDLKTVKQNKQIKCYFDTLAVKVN